MLVSFLSVVGTTLQKERWLRFFGHGLKWKNCSILVFERSSDHETIPS
jgi:hypothetical protein